MKVVELLQYLINGMDTSHPPKHIINGAIKEVEEFKALIDENKILTNTLMKVYEEMIKLREENQELKNATNNIKDDEYFGIAKYKDCQFVVEYEDCIDNIDNGNFEAAGVQQ